MGLDMYLKGQKFVWTDWEHPENNPTEDGFKVTDRWLELGYWRKHPDLHGYIVKTFGGEEDTGGDIWLSADHMKQIIEAIKGDQLPHTEGFFFGQSQNSERQKSEAIETFEKAIAWAEAREKGVSRTVYYHASW